MDQKSSGDNQNLLWQRLLSGYQGGIKPDFNRWAHFLPEGCRRCLHGGRMCLTVGENCPKNCFYCSNPMGTDLVRADEFTIHSDDDLVRLVRLSEPDAVCLSGGEPTLYMDRVLRFTRVLREECGPDFHIQLFTANAATTLEQMKQAREAGVDEIRCHLASDKEGHLVERALELDWTVAVEIPSLPMAGITEGIVRKAIELGAAFVNLHELLYFEGEEFQRVARRCNLEPTDNPIPRKVPYRPSDQWVWPGDIPARLGTTLVSTRGSMEMAEKMMALAQETPDCKTAVHFCSMASKYLTQIPNRLARKAVKLRRPYEDVSPDGTLVSVMIRCPDETLVAPVKECLEQKFRLSGEKVGQSGTMLIVPWIVAMKKVLFGELLSKIEISLYERYPVPEGVRMSDDDMYLEFTD